MRVEYQTLESDCLAFVRYVNLDRFRTRYWFQVLQIPLGVWLGVAIAIPLTGSEAIPLGLAFGVLVSLVSARLSWIRFKRQVQGLLDIYPPAPTMAEISPTGIATTTATTTTKFAWPRVMEITEARGLLLFVHASGKGMTLATFVPRRAFATEAAYVSFRDEAKRLHVAFSLSGRSGDEWS